MPVCALGAPLICSLRARRDNLRGSCPSAPYEHREAPQGSRANGQLEGIAAGHAEPHPTPLQLSHESVRGHPQALLRRVFVPGEKIRRRRELHLRRAVGLRPPRVPASWPGREAGPGNRAGSPSPREFRGPV